MKKHHVYPWWAAFMLDNPIRNLMDNSKNLLGKYVKPEMEILEIGCGNGFFTFKMADLLQNKGKVICVDIQPQMLQSIKSKARRKGVENLITTVLCKGDDLCINTKSDFALLAYVAHETPSQKKLFLQIKENLKPKAKFLLIEPTKHISEEEFKSTLTIAENAGFVYLEDLSFKLGHRALLEAS